MPRWAESQRHTVVVVCVCEWVNESFHKIAVRISLWALKIKARNVQCKLNTVLSWNEIGGFWISSFIVELWRDLLTLTVVTSNPEFSKEQIPHNRLLINMTGQSVQQIRQQPEWNPENKTAKATQPNFCLPWTVCNWRCGLIWHPYHPCRLHGISCYCSLCTQRAICLATLLLILSLPTTVIVVSQYSSTTVEQQ